METKIVPKVGANTGTDTGTTTRAERMLKPGEITNRMGKDVFGASGSINGSSMGPGAAIFILPNLVLVDTLKLVPNIFLTYIFVKMLSVPHN